MGFPGTSDGEECRRRLQCRRPRFNPWVGKIPWRREGLPAPVFLPGEFHGQRILASYSPRGLKESNTTERLSHIYIYILYIHKYIYIMKYCACLLIY